MSIQSRATLGADVLLDHTIIIRVSGCRLCPGFFLAVGNERLLTCYGDESPASARQQLRPMRLKPCLVPSGTLILCLEPGDCDRVVDFLDENRVLHGSSPGYAPASSPCLHVSGLRRRTDVNLDPILIFIHYATCHLLIVVGS
jgi:hypothetical protein